MPEIGYLEAINQALHEEMERDTNVFMAGIDIAERGDVFGATQGLYSKYGKSRIMDTPIAENGIIGLAIGSAARGLRPVVTIMFMDFIGVCFDQILNQMAKMKYMYGGKVKLPLVVLTNAGAGTSSAAQHSQSLEVLLCHIPGLKVVMPCDAVRREGPDEGGDPGGQPGVRGAAQAPRPHPRRGAGGRLRGADRQGHASCARARTSRSSPRRTWCTRRWRRPTA